MDEIAPKTRPVPAGWLEALAESRAELAAGLTVLGHEVMRELYASIARLEAGHTDGKTRRVARRRRSSSRHARGGRFAHFGTISRNESAVSAVA